LRLLVAIICVSVMDHQTIESNEPIVIGCLPVPALLGAAVLLGPWGELIHSSSKIVQVVSLVRTVGQHEFDRGRRGQRTKLRMSPPAAGPASFLTAFLGFSFAESCCFFGDPDSDLI
jgi:hypothetical protein